MDKEILAAYKDLGISDAEIAQVPESWTPEQHFDFLKQEAAIRDAQSSPASTPEPNLTTLAEITPEDFAAAAQNIEQDIRRFDKRKLAQMSGNLPGFGVLDMEDAANIANYVSDVPARVEDVKGLYQNFKTGADTIINDPKAAAKVLAPGVIEAAGSMVGGALGFRLFGVPGAMGGSGAGGTLARELNEELGLVPEQDLLASDKMIATAFDVGTGGIGYGVGKSLGKAGEILKKRADNLIAYADPVRAMAEILKYPTRAAGLTSEAIDKFRGQVSQVLGELVTSAPIDTVEGVFKGMDAKLAEAAGKVGDNIALIKQQAMLAVKNQSGGKLPRFTFEELFRPLDELSNQQVFKAKENRALRQEFLGERDKALRTILPGKEYADLQDALKFFKNPKIARRTGPVNLFSGGEEGVEQLAPKIVSESTFKGTRASLITPDTKAEELYKTATKHLESIQAARTKLSTGEYFDLEQVDKMGAKYSKSVQRYNQTALKDTKESVQNEADDLLRQHFDGIFEEKVKEASPQIAADLRDANLLYGAYKDVRKQVGRRLKEEKARLGKINAERFAPVEVGDSGINASIALKGGYMPAFNIHKNVGKSEGATLLAQQEGLQNQILSLSKYIKSPPSEFNKRLSQWGGSLGSLLVKADPVTTNTGEFFGAATGEMLQQTLKAGELSLSDSSEEVPQQGVQIAQKLLSAYMEGQGLPPEDQRELLSQLVSDPELVNAGVFKKSEHPLTNGLVSIVDNRVTNPKERDLVRKRIDQLDISLAEKAKATTALNKDHTLVEMSQKKPITQSTYTDTREKVELGTLVNNINSAKSTQQDKDILKARRASNVLDFRRTGSE